MMYTQYGTFMKVSSWVCAIFHEAQDTNMQGMHESCA